MCKSELKKMIKEEVDKYSIEGMKLLSDSEVEKMTRNIQHYGRNIHDRAVAELKRRKLKKESKLDIAQIVKEELKAIMDEQSIKQWIGDVPAIDDFGDKIIDTFIDGKTKHGPWATMTPKSWKEHGIGRLGIGAGQKYVKDENKWILSESTKISEHLLIERELTAKEFVAAVNDEYDIEVLDTMIEVINNRKTVLMKMYDTANPRAVVKGFKRK